MQMHTICENIAALRKVRDLVQKVDVFHFDGFRRNVDGTWTADYSYIAPVVPNENDESEQWLDELNADYSNSRGV